MDHVQPLEDAVGPSRKRMKINRVPNTRSFLDLEAQVDEEDSGSDEDDDIGNENLRTLFLFRLDLIEDPTSRSHIGLAHELVREGDFLVSLAAKHINVNSSLSQGSRRAFKLLSCWGSCV